MRRWFRAISRRPGLVLACTLAFTLLMAAGLVDPRSGALRLTVDPSPESLLPQEGPEREVYDRVRRMFGSDEPFLIVLGAEDLFSVELLERIVELTRRLEAIDGVSRVLSLANGTNVRAVEGDVLIEPFLDPVPREPDELARLRRDVLRNPLYAGTLVSKDATATAVLAYLERMSDQELVASGIDGAIAEVVHEVVGDAAETWISGAPHLKVVLGTSMLRELAVMLPAIVVILGVVLWFALRTARGVALPLVAVLAALVWTLGTLGWLGQNLNLVTVTVPTLVLTIGFAYALHVVSDYQDELREAAPDVPAPRELVRRTLDAVGLPVLVTAVTTAAGFLSLVLYPVPAIREFGLFSLLAVFFTAAAALTLVPAILALLPSPRSRGAPGEDERPLERLAGRVGDLVASHRRLVIGGAIAVTVVSLAGVPRIRVAAEFIGVLSPEHPIRADYEAINERLGGAREMRILVETDAPGALLEPASLRALESFQGWLEEQPEVGKTVSIVDYLKLLHRALRDDEPEAFTVPDTRSLAGQLLLFGASPDSQRLIDGSYQIANILVTSKVADSDEVARLVDRIERRAEQLPSHLHAQVTGMDVLLGRVVDEVSWGQFQSVAMAFALIYLLLAFLFTSFQVGLVALLPNALPIAFYFGALGWGGITLNPSTSLVGCLALGIAVDDTIHFIARFNTEARKRADEASGTRATLRAVIRPVTFTTLGLCLGFLVLMFSENRGLGEFGMVAALTLAMAWLTDVTLTPALCSQMRIVTLWDLLRTDLGEQPQREIPLFHDLSPRQARIFALMADLRPFTAGERVITQGDRADDMFVIVRGELGAWVGRDALREDLRTMGRGAVVGEVGYFTHKRTANVDALTDGLMIRFDSEDLERLRRVYPRVGATVYRNLNRIQAERQADSTERLRR
jgi:uncharacterized protein